MRKVLKIAAFIAIIVISAITLTAGISKDGSRTGGYKDLVDELYEQAVNQNSNLETIEEDIQKFYKKKEDALEKYNSYIAYNNRYYTDAKSKTNQIVDANTKQKALELINKSEANYKIKLSDWQNTITSLQNNEKELNDLHNLLKITVTEPMIQKFQGTLPDNTKLKESSNDLQQITLKIKAITR
jgi:hypothetical protein